MLLQLLPPELVLHVFDLLDNKSLSSVVLTCRAARNLARSSSTLIRSKIAELPGYAISDQEPSEHLWAILTRRATWHLQSVNTLLTDSVLFATSQKLKSTRTLIRACSCSHRHIICAAFNPDGTIHIYKTNGRDVELRHVVPAAQFENASAETEDVVSPEGFNFQLFAFLEGGRPKDCVPDLGVLYACPKLLQTKETDHEGRPVECFTMRFVSYSFDWLKGPSLSFRKNITTTALGNMPPSPTALAFTKHYVTIALCSQKERRWSTEILILQDKRQRYDKPASHDGSSKITSYWRNPYEKGSKWRIVSDGDVKIARIESHKRHARLSPRNFPTATHILSSTYDVQSSSPHQETIDTGIPEHNSSFVRPFLGQTLTWFHRCGIPEVDPSRKECINTTLQIAFSCDVRPVPDRRTGAYIVKAVSSTQNCTSFDPTVQHPMAEHITVAKLVGIDVVHIPTTGIQLAISPCRSRIALSNWKRVLVYAIDPDAFLNGSLLPSGEDEDDKAYVEACGFDYYRRSRLNGSDADTDDGDLIPLYPEVLPEMGVVYGLEFGKGDSLWAWTDRGLVHWNFGHEGKGKRGVMNLDGCVEEKSGDEYGDMMDVDGVVEGSRTLKGKEMVTGKVVPASGTQ